MPVSLILHILGLSIGVVLYVLPAHLPLRARSVGESTGQQTILLLIASTNIEQRLRYHYGRDASLIARSVPGVGTTAELRVPRRVA